MITGNVEEIPDDKYRLVTNDVVIEKQIVSKKDEPIQNEDLVAAIEVIEQKYDGEYSVVTMLKKNANK